MPKDAEAIWTGLQSYSGREDRTDPAVFAGRGEELKDLTIRLSQAASPENPAGLTTIVQGIPGAGKTALGSEFKKRIHGKPIALQGDKLAICVDISASELGEPPKDMVSAMHGRILRALSQDASGGQKVRGVLQRYGELVGDICSRILQRNTEAENMVARNQLADTSSLHKCLDAYAPVWGNDLVLVMVVDEAQTIPLNQNARKTLQDLHLQPHQCRILPVLIGLPDTEGRITDRDPAKGLGLSRLSGMRSVKTIGCLNPAQGNEPSESRQAITGTLKALGLDWSEPGWRDILRDCECDENKWIQWRAALVEQLEEDSADFPQHITAGLIATCDALLDPQKRLDFNQALRDDIAHIQQEFKHHYYSRRLAGSTELYAPAFGALCELEAEGHSVGEHEVMTALDVCKDRSAIASHPESPSTLTVLHTALSKGILQKHGKAFYFNEIPSLSSHLRNQYQQDLEIEDPTAEALREALEPDGGWTSGGGGPK